MTLRGIAPLCLGALAALCSASCISATPSTVRTFESTPRAISELKRGWADAVLGDYPVMAHMARESTGTLEVVREQFDPSPFGIALRKGSEPLHAAMTNALRSIMATTAYMDILRTWGIHIGKVDPPAAPAAVPASSEVPQLADGKLLVGAEMAYAPMEFFDDFKHQAGADVELANALGKQLGVEVEIVDMPFDALLPALAQGKVDLVISAMTITPEREVQADFIPYLMAGTGILVKAGNPAKIRRMKDLCGKKIALQEGISQVQQVHDLPCD